jgi:hypothetical protein
MHGTMNIKFISICSGYKGFLSWVYSSWGMALITHLHLLPRVTMSRAIPLAPSKAQGMSWAKLTFTGDIMRILLQWLGQIKKIIKGSRIKTHDRKRLLLTNADEKGSVCSL